jgi:ribosomal protein S18 acetylase RimI-like enzyme
VKPEGLLIRPAGPDDIAPLQRLDSVVPDNPGRASDIAQWVESGACLCAHRDGVPVGYAVTGTHFFGQPILEMLMVDRAFRGQGVARQLVRQVIGETPGPVLWASTNQSNLPMQGLLTELGFVRSGFIEGLDEGDPELIYRLRLS